jgi:hypothetical protein
LEGLTEISQDQNFGNAVLIEKAKRISNKTEQNEEIKMRIKRIPYM